MTAHPDSRPFPGLRNGNSHRPPRSAIRRSGLLQRPDGVSAFRTGTLPLAARPSPMPLSAARLTSASSPSCAATETVTNLNLLNSTYFASEIV